MSDVAEFLLARIAEDEAVAQEAQRNVQAVPVGATIFHRADLDHIARHDPARVLAECEAKRRIVEWWAARADGDWAAGSPMVGYRAALRDVLRLLALPYADHPSYDEAWRP